MIKFKEYLNEAGQAAGKLEVAKTSVDKAREHAEKILDKKGKSLDKELPNFDANYEKAKKLANYGKTKRKDMPVIDANDVRQFQRRLKEGFIDVNIKHHAITTDVSNPFPEGLSGEKAKTWLKAGLKRNDNDKPDDIVKVKEGSIEVGKLKPIQKQIYFDKSFGDIANFGIKGTTSFLTGDTYFIVSADNFIIDGHHRFLSGVLVDPKMKVKTLVIDLPISKLLPLTLAYGDAIGNKRNK